MKFRENPAFDEIERLIRENAPAWDAKCRSWGEEMAETGGCSAIEAAMNMGWVCVFNEFGCGRIDPREGADMEVVKSSLEDPEWPAVNPQIWSQIQIGKYRVDFLIAVKDATGNHQLIVVECDGHDFHERTKEQAEHDRKRDRHLQTLGYIVLRFTGAEIWREPTMCAWAAIRQALEAWTIGLAHGRRA